MDVMEINVITGKVVERDFTPDELAQRQVDKAASAQTAAAQEAAATIRVQALDAARAFALSLGFTEAMLAVMYPQLEGA